MIPETDREAILRLTMCARRNCAICKYGPKKPRVKLSESCAKRITENMNITKKYCGRTKSTSVSPVGLSENLSKANCPKKP